MPTTSPSCCTAALRATTRPASSGRARTTPRLIAGLIPSADGPMTDDMRQALDGRREMIKARADAVLDTAREAGKAWTRSLGEPPRDPRKAGVWRRSARTIAAYRDPYGITDDTAIGPPAEAEAQRIDRARAAAALTHVRDQDRARRDGQAAPQRSITVEREGRVL